MEKKHEKHRKSHTNGKPSTSVHFSPSCKSSSEKGLRTRFAIALRMQGWSHWPLTCTKLWSARSSLRNRKIGEVCRDGIRVCQTSWKQHWPKCRGMSNIWCLHFPVDSRRHWRKQTVVALTCRFQVAPEERSVLTLACRPQVSFWAGPVLVERGSNSRAVSSGLLEDLRTPAFTGRYSRNVNRFDQLELQQLFLDLYRLYRPYSLSAHSLDTGTLVPWKCKNASGTYSVIGNLWASGWPSWLKAAFQQETATGKNPTGFYADTCFC